MDISQQQPQFTQYQASSAYPPPFRSPGIQTPYVLFAQAVAVAVLPDVRAQGDTLAVKTEFANLEDMRYYDEECGVGSGGEDWKFRRCANGVFRGSCWK